MQRNCDNCHKALAAHELNTQQTQSMEAERRAAGLRGLRFHYYACSRCGHVNLFVDVHLLAGETHGEFERRKRDLEEAVGQLRTGDAAVVLVERQPSLSEGRGVRG